MRLLWRLILSIALSASLVVLIFTVWQAHNESIRQVQELDRRSRLLEDSLRELVTEPWSRGDAATLDRLINRFADRARLTGVALGRSTDAGWHVTGSLQPLAGAVEAESEQLAAAGLVRDPQDFSMSLSGRTLRVRVSAEPAPRLVIVQDAGFIRERVARIWRNNFFRLLAQVALVSLVAILIVYLQVMSPIRRTVEWMRSVRMGDGFEQKPVSRTDKLLAPLVREVSQMARSLTLARAAAEEEARLRQMSESVWTPERLKEFVRAKLKTRPLLAVSNREPYRHVRRGKDVECIVPASGLVTALEPVLKACGGTWIAEGDGDADRDTVDANDRLRVPPEEPQYSLRRVWVSAEERQGYYYGFANEGLWPLCHVAHTRPVFRESDWLQYEAVNRKFARVVLEEMEGASEPCVLIQDYHFALLPRIIKQKRPDARVAIFWHIPWPNPEFFGICPWQKDLLQGMLGADLIGFHTQFHCNNFLETVDRSLESLIDYEHFTVNREGHTTRVKPFPISIAFTGTEVQPPDLSKKELLKPYGLTADWIGVGVDRLDYTKGILERFVSVEHFLDKNPSYQGRFTFVELGAPSRESIQKYQDFAGDLEREAERINNRFKTKNWKPILLLKKHHSHREIQPFYRAADLCLVTSLHDGMNLVAKEFVISRDDEKGVLILSQFTGASRELVDALIVNPYDVVQGAEAIRRALEMPEAEQAERMRHMRSLLKDRNIYRWAADLVDELTQVRIDRNEISVERLG